MMARAKKKALFKMACAVLACTLAALLFSSCAIPATELENRAIVNSVGIDYSEEKGFQVTIAYYSMDASTSGDQTPVTQQVGSTSALLHEAFSGAVSSAGRNLFWGHIEYLVIGEKAAYEKLDDILEYAATGGILGADIGVCIARGSAKETVSAVVKEHGGVVKALDNLLNNEDSAFSAYVRLFQIAKEMREKGTGGYLPVVSVGNTVADKSQNEGNGDRIIQSIDFIDIILFDRGKVTGYVGSERIPWFLCAFSDCRLIEVHCQSEIGDIFASVEYPSLSFGFADEKTLNMTMRGQLAVSCVVKDGSLVTDYNYAAVKAAVEKECEEQLQKMFFELSGVSGNDIFELKLRYQIKYGKNALDMTFSDTIELAAQASVALKAVA